MSKMITLQVQKMRNVKFINLEFFHLFNQLIQKKKGWAIFNVLQLLKRHERLVVALFRYHYSSILMFYFKK